MNSTVLKIIRAVLGTVVLIVLFTTVRGWWTAYRAAPKPAAAETESTSTASGDTTSAEGMPIEEVEGTLVVLIDGLNLREKPAIDGEKIRAMEKKDKLTLLKRQGDWYYVRTDKDEEGWVSANKNYTKRQK